MVIQHWVLIIAVGSNNISGREIVEEHLELCLEAGLEISGINAEVMPGQWAPNWSMIT